MQSSLHSPSRALSPDPSSLRIIIVVVRNNGEPDPVNYNLRRLRQHTWEGLPFEVRGSALQADLAWLYYADGRRRRAPADMRRNVDPRALVALSVVLPPLPGFVSSDDDDEDAL
jgi:hypothetical protein